MKKNIWIISGGRAEYFLLENLLSELKKIDKFRLRLVLTGSHFSRKFGNTYNQISTKVITKEIKTPIISDTREKTLIYMGNLMKKFSKEMIKSKPNLIIIVGDRYEIFVAAQCAMILKIPIAHVHGGEITEGAFDDTIRHAITKLSHIHFVSTEEYQKRVIQLGEMPKNIFNVGSLGVQNIKKLKYLKKLEIEKKLKIKLNKKNFLITFHPVTLSKKKESIVPLLKVIKKIKNTNFIFTAPNMDPGNNEIFNQISKFTEKNKNGKFFPSLGQQLYFSCAKHFDLIIGNSSSGIIEIPTLKKPTINIGQRQKGRIISRNIINCENNEISIKKALKKVFSKEFVKKIKNTKNPYYKYNTSKRIASVLKKKNLRELIYKKFYDL